jgi:hypothetical protein
MKTRYLNRGRLAALIRNSASGLGVAGLLIAAPVTAVSRGAESTRPLAHPAHLVALPAGPVSLAQLPRLQAAVQRTISRSRQGTSKNNRSSAEVRSLGDKSLQNETHADSGLPGPEQGYSVAISGNTAVVSAPGFNNNTGLAYIYVWKHGGGGWQPVVTLPDPQGGENDGYAWSVAISSTKAGNYVAIGSNANNGTLNNVYVYTGSGLKWTLEATITDPGGDTPDRFGDALAISSTTLVIGAYCDTENVGAIYIYQRSGSTWTLQGSKVDDPANNPGDNYGNALAVSGNTVLVGALDAAYVYTNEAGQGWTQAATLANPGASDDNFGESVALAGTTAVIGAPGNPPGSSTLLPGAAYVYTGSGSTWTQKQKLTHPAGTKGDIFGYSLAMNSTTMLISMPVYGATGCGTAYMYKPSGGTWTEQARQADPDCQNGDDFGFSVALFGTYGVYGAPCFNSGQGATYIRKLP